VIHALNVMFRTAARMTSDLETRQVPSCGSGLWHVTPAPSFIPVYNKGGQACWTWKSLTLIFRSREPQKAVDWTNVCAYGLSLTAVFFCMELTTTRARQPRGLSSKPNRVKNFHFTISSTPKELFVSLMHRPRSITALLSAKPFMNCISAKS
jgi:hypothetical protein